MIGRIAALALVLAGLAGGAGMYYLQAYGYYDRLPSQATVRAVGVDGAFDMPVNAFEGIDSDSSPLRYRACFTLADPAPALAEHANPTPLNAPGWFSCFNAGQLDADLEGGQARALVVESNFLFGFDRVMALYPDGRAYLWHQMNACGTAHFDGRTLPQGCPPAPES